MRILFVVVLLALANVSPALANIRIFGNTREQQSDVLSRSMPHYFALGDSITHGYLVQDPTLNGYPARVAGHFGLRLTNLGTDGWTSAGVIATELPMVQGTCALATIDIGTNDAADIQRGTETIEQYETNVTFAVRVLQTRCQRVAVLGLIVNAYQYAAEPFLNGMLEMNAFLPTIPGVTFVDLTSDRRLHDWNDFAFPGSLHPNAAGDGAMAQDVETMVYEAEAGRR